MLCYVKLIFLCFLFLTSYFLFLIPLFLYFLFFSFFIVVHHHLYSFSMLNHRIKHFTFDFKTKANSQKSIFNYMYIHVALSIPVPVTWLGDSKNSMWWWGWYKLHGDNIMFIHLYICFSWNNIVLWIFLLSFIFHRLKCF